MSEHVREDDAERLRLEHQLRLARDRHRKAVARLEALRQQVADAQARLAEADR